MTARGVRCIWVDDDPHAARLRAAAVRVRAGHFHLHGVETPRNVESPSARRSPQDDLTEQVARGKRLWDEGNCMGCHTILGEGGYYAPEMTKVYQRRGPAFIRAMLEDPQGMYPGERKMQEYDYSNEEIDALVAFFEWVGRIDTNGFPPRPYLVSVAVPAAPGGAAVATATGRPKVFNQMCIACHALGGQGGRIGPPLDTVGDRLSRAEFVAWLDEPQKVKPGTTMPDLPLSDAEVKELAAFLVQLRTHPQTQPAGG